MEVLGQDEVKRPGIVLQGAVCPAATWGPCTVVRSRPWSQTGRAGILRT